MKEPSQSQQRVLDEERLSLLIKAPAGCGKTEAMAMRVEGLLARRQVEPPRRILLLSFSNRARDNLRNRVIDRIGRPAYVRSIQSHNLHGLSDRIVRAHGNTISLDVGQTAAGSQWLDRQLKDWTSSYKHRRAVSDQLHSAKLAGNDDKMLLDILGALVDPTALQIEGLRQKERVLTYDDLPRYAELILANDAVAGLYANHFGAILVDEFQDLTPQQLRIVQAIGRQKTTYAGDLAQGIYSFTGASPAVVQAVIEREVQATVEFTESYRSSPAVLSIVNALAPRVGAQVLTCAVPENWPGGGLAAGSVFEDTDDEALWVVDRCRQILAHSDRQRIGVISRIDSRRKTLDHLVAQSGDLPSHNWKDPVHDVEVARLVRSSLARIGTVSEHSLDHYHRSLWDATDNVFRLDPELAERLDDAFGWVSDLLASSVSTTEISSRIRTDGAEELTSAPGIHLLNGHVGKGQQFDWVFVLGVEEETIPYWAAKSDSELDEEARILSVMVSRARHGVLMTRVRTLQVGNGPTKTPARSRFIECLGIAGVELRSAAGAEAWLGATAHRAR